MADEGTPVDSVSLLQGQLDLADEDTPADSVSLQQGQLDLADKDTPADSVSLLQGQLDQVIEKLDAVEKKQASFADENKKTQNKLEELNIFVSSRLDGTKKTSSMTSKRIARASILSAALFLLIALTTSAWAIGDGVESTYDSINGEVEEYFTVSTGLWSREMKQGATRVFETLNLSNCKATTDFGAGDVPLPEDSHCSSLLTTGMLTIFAFVLTVNAACFSFTAAKKLTKVTVASLVLANIILVAAMGVYGSIVGDVVSYAVPESASFSYRYGYSWGLALAAFFLNLIGGVSLKVDDLPS